MKSIRALSALTLITALCVSLAVPAFGDARTSFAATGGSVYYSSDASSITIESADSGVTAVDIPSKIGSLPVKTIAYAAFRGCSGLSSVSIPESVTTIGGYAFDGTPWLRNQTGDFVTVNGILIMCRSSASEIRIPTGTTAIGSNVFDSCNRSFTVTIPSTVSTIGCDAFYNCSFLTGLTLAEGLRIIGDGAFYGCTRLSSAALPTTVAEIGALAFYGCTSLRSITLPSSLSAIEYQVFSGCTSLASIAIPYGCASIGCKAFKGCTTLAAVSIPSSVAAIQCEAFLGCTSLKSAAVPGSVKFIGKHALGYRDASSAVYAFKIMGVPGSAADTYASDNSFTFSKTAFPAAAAVTTKFSDVPSTAWYAPYVASAASDGLINGKTATTYVPSGSMTYAEAVKLAACLHQRNAEGTVTLKNGNPWYKPYVDYCVQNGIIASSYAPVWKNAITRADFAVLLAAALPESEFESINDVADGAIPDVAADVSYAGAVYTLYRAGILKGSGQFCAFTPDSTIKRSEVAAVLVRITDKSSRVSLIL